MVESYAELVAEGWLTAQQGSGTRVATGAKPRRAASEAPRARTDAHRPRYGLLTGSPDLANFPRTQWLAAARRALTAAPNDALGYGDARGRVELRTRSPTTWRGPAGCTPSPSGSSSVPVSTTVWR